MREAAEAEAREVLDREVAIVDDERELVVVGRVGDLAHRLGGVLELAAARADHAAQVDRRRVQPALACEICDQLALGVGELARVVGGAAAQVGALAGGADGGIGSLRLIASSRASTPAWSRVSSAMSTARRWAGPQYGRVGPRAQDALERVERGAVGAGARERDAEVVLGVLVLDEVGEAL